MKKPIKLFYPFEVLIAGTVVVLILLTELALIL
jgi:hypothetical protein